MRFAGEFSSELLALLSAIIAAKAESVDNKKEIDIWDEETEVGKNIVYDGKVVKASTLNQLVIRLTDPRTSDQNFSKVKKRQS